MAKPVWISNFFIYFLIGAPWTTQFIWAPHTRLFQGSQDEEGSRPSWGASFLCRIFCAGFSHKTEAAYSNSLVPFLDPSRVSTFPEDSLGGNLFI